MGMTRGCHLGFRTNRVLFVFVSFNFSFCRAKSVTKDEVSDLIKAGKEEIMASFKELLKDSAGQIKREINCTDETSNSAEYQIKDIKFKRKSIEDQYKCNLKLAGRPSTAPSPLPRGTVPP